MRLAKKTHRNIQSNLFRAWGKPGGSPAQGTQKSTLPKAVGFRKGDVVMLRPAPVRTWPKGYWKRFGPRG